MDKYKYYNENFNIDKDVYEFVINIEETLRDRFSNLDEIEEYNILKILKAFQDSRLSASDFGWPTGYGYGDVGRDKVEEIYSKIFKTEDALVRPSIASGTHALSLTLQGLLLPGDTILSITGDPYDTLQQVIGIAGNEKGTLIDYGIKYKKIELDANGKIQLKLLPKFIDKDVKLVTIQRSTGYSLRNAISLDEMKEAVNKIKNINKEIIVMVDNCYGEFTQILEPTEIGADLAVGSLIKNPGGGIALSGGYVVGSKENIEKISNRLTAPGIGKETGLSFGTTRLTLQGLYFAPKVTMEALKGALLFARTFEKLGYKTFPSSDAERFDIIEAIMFEKEELVIEFCRAIQEASVVDSFVVPYPWEMPGYTDKVIMASGSFIDGSSIELSADGPLREPYIVYFQGGLNYFQCKYALMLVLQKFKNKEFINIKKLLFK
ncbi:aminotransferase class I/II-fold pyridoxal phosphate-dependent enzyme [Miniphocaeibacter massiliensis]|uniref:methionine gamma-lyase family protein n=1 Tax=Miniphocaeibacter massiliensis TaxID=2041841 RepID=UPI000C068EC5|nr:methionine gamma-lyase family protein [Miniphocaeibacter massiliensis]